MLSAVINKALVVAILLVFTGFSETVLAQEEGSFLTGDELKKTFIGNTITFRNQRGPGDVFMFFDRDGTYKTARGYNGKWWTEKDELFCRKSDNRRRPRCWKVRIKGDIVRFYSQDGTFRSEVSLLQGDQHSAFAPVKPGTFTDSRGQLIHREFLSHSKDKNKKVEIFWTTPDGEGPWPAIIFIHGHQIRDRIGGEGFVNVGRLRRMARRGYVAVSVSQPGYGNSDGSPDFCGPFTQDAVLAAIQFMRKNPFVMPNRVGLAGISRGAIVASMVATKDSELAAVVLIAGTYDLGKGYPTGLSRLDANIRAEAGTSPEAFRVRSAIYHADKIKAPVLLLHGAYDDRSPPEEVEAFAQKLMANGVPVQLKIFPDAGHGIPYREAYREIIYPFLQKYLH